MATFVWPAHEPHALEGAEVRPIMERALDVGNNDFRWRKRAMRIKDKLDRVPCAVGPLPLLSTDMPDCLAAVEPPIWGLVRRVFFRQVGHNFRTLPIPESRELKGNAATSIYLAEDVRLRRVALCHRRRGDAQAGALPELLEHLEFQDCLFGPVGHVLPHRIVIVYFGSCADAVASTIVALQYAKLNR